MDLGLWSWTWIVTILDGEMNVRELMDSHEWCLVCFMCFTPSLSQIRVIHSTQLRSLISDNPGQIPVNKWCTWDKELSPTKEFPNVWTILLNIMFFKTQDTPSISKHYLIVKRWSFPWFVNFREERLSDKIYHKICDCEAKI